MKTCEEMARSVMVRAKAYKRRKCWIMSTSVACICCIILGIVFWGGPRDDQPVIQMQQNSTTSTTTSPVEEKPPIVEDPPIVENPPVDTGARITFLSTAGNKPIAVGKDVVLPLHMELRKFDWRGMTEEEKDQLEEAERTYAKDIIEASNVKGFWGQGYHGGMYQLPNTLVSYLMAGHIIIGMDDPAELESIYLETGGAIQLCYVDPMEGDDNEDRYYMDSAAIKRQYWIPYGGIYINWMPDGDKLYEYDENPPIDLTKFSDYIKIVVTFKDGTVEEHQIDIVVAEDGKTSAIYRGLAETF